MPRNLRSARLSPAHAAAPLPREDAPPSRKRGRPAPEAPSLPPRAPERRNAEPPPRIGRPKKRARGAESSPSRSARPEPSPHALASSHTLASPHALASSRGAARATRSSLSLAFAAGPSPEARQMRALARDLIAATAAGDSAAQGRAVRDAIAAHPEVLAWMLEGRDLSALMNEAELAMLPSSLHASLAALAELSVGLRAAATERAGVAELFASGSALYDAYQGTSERSVFGAMGAFARGLASPALWSGSALASCAIDEGRRALSSRADAIGFEGRAALLDRLPESVYRQIALAITEGLTDARFSDSEEVQVMLDPERGLDLEHLPLVFQSFVRMLLTQYFDRLPTEDKRLMIVPLLDVPPGAPVEEKLGAMLHHSGPAVQKLFQLVAEYARSEKLAGVFAALKARIEPFPPEQARAAIERSLGAPLDRHFSRFTDRPLGSASVGQVHAATLRSTGEPVIVKVQRPGLVERAARELSLLRSLAPDEGTKKLVDRLQESLNEELDFRLEARNLEAGRVYDQPEKGLSAVRLIPELSATRDVMVMTRARAHTIDACPPEQLGPKIQGLCTLLETWLDEALFGGGFFHGDLHAGNVFFDAAPETGRSPRLTLIDFGNAERLSATEQRTLLHLIVGAAFGSTERTLESLAGLVTMTPAQRTELRRFTERTMAEPIDAGAAMGKVINHAVELGIGLPKSLLGFNRGWTFVEQQIVDSNRAAAELGPSGRGAQHDPTRVLRSLLLRRVGENVVASLLGYDSKISARDLLELGSERLFGAA